MYFVYIISNRDKTVLYTGITHNIIRRVYEHKYKYVDSFTHKYRCMYLLYYEKVENMKEAIEREKYIESQKRQKKDILISSMNPCYKDLYSELKDQNAIVHLF